MPASILIVTPNDSFGAMLRSSLEQTGQYRVFIVADQPTALIQLRVQGCAGAFLDIDLGAQAVVEIGRALRLVKPNLGLTIVTDDATPPALDSIRPWTLLRKPFYMPELIESLGSAAEKEPQKISASLSSKMQIPSQPMDDSSDLSWLEDVNRSAQRLTRLTLESSAQAALITRGKKLWAYAGGLSNEAANELVLLVTRNWDENNSGDLLRFARLETTRAEHMLYASALAPDTILALVFDAETPFSTIRTQASSLTRALSVEKTGPATTVQPEPPSEVKPTRPALFLNEDEDEDDDKTVMPLISGIISDIPTPKPQPAFHALDKQVTLRADSEPASRESSPPVQLRELMVGELDETVRREAQELDVTAPSRVKRAATPVRPPLPGELDETRPHSLTEVAGQVILEPASAGLYQLNYACLLVPRFSAHYLTGDLADNLSIWLPNICVAFGWRLEFQAVRPEYAQWVVSVPPNTSPGYLMRVMRQQTSEKIFVEMPVYKRENPSGDFWAPGYLIMGGNQAHPQQLVKDYIKQTRQRQGQTQPRK